MDQKMDFETQDVVSAILDGNEVEGTIIQITGVDTAIMETKWGKFTINLNQTTLLYREEMFEVAGIDY